LQNPTGSPKLSGMIFDRSTFAKAVKALAGKNVFIGTSSWKYSGWAGQIYDETRYEYRRKFTVKGLVIVEQAEGSAAALIQGLLADHL